MIVATFRILLLGGLVAIGDVRYLEAASWYIAPSGDDAAMGTLEKPFASIQRAQEAASPGDTVFIRGGVYSMRDSALAQRRRIFGRVIVLDKSGAPDRPIVYRAYENERPVFDFSNVKPANLRVTAFYVSGSWLHLIGLDITGVQVTIRGHTQSICVESQGNHNVFEGLRLHDGQAIGIYHVHGSDNLFLNCDAWNNWDYTSEDGKGENVDGFGCHPPKGSRGNVFRGCRAWFNSDDGFDCINADEVVTFENCWATYSGYSPKFDRLANGNGFKIGGYGARPAKELPNPIPRHVVRFCMSMKNKNGGFYANHHPGGCDWINNTAYSNGINFNMQGRLNDNRTEVDGTGHRLFRNLSYGSRRDIANFDAEKCELTDNSFTLELKLSDQDFLTVDESEFTRGRERDGKLPIIEFLRPTAPGRLGAVEVLGSDGRRVSIGAFNAQ